MVQGAAEFSATREQQILEAVRLWAKKRALAHHIKVFTLLNPCKFIPAFGADVYAARDCPQKGPYLEYRN